MIQILPSISIVTPFYNTGTIFKETIKSIYRQTLVEWEWIIVNDGTYDTIALLQLDQLKNNNDSRIKIIDSPTNKGLPWARNKGISKASADYIFFIDSDDLIEPSTVEKLYLFLLANPTFHFANTYVHGFGNHEYYWRGGFHERTLFLKENRNTSCFMARRQVFDKVLFDESMTQGCEDWEFWLHSASEQMWGYTVPEFLFHYRRSANDKWATLAGKETLQLVKKIITKKYSGNINKNGFPNPSFEKYIFGKYTPPLLWAGITKKERQTLICIFPWLKIGGVDKFNIDLLKGLKNKGWSIVILTTKGSDHPWQNYFEEITTDIFHLDNLGPAHTHNALVDYFIVNRQPDTLFLSNSMYGYFMLPYIKNKFPNISVVDYAHCEEPDWYNGGYPFFSALYTDYLDKSFVTSAHLQKWVIDKGADAKKIEVCYIGVDTILIKKNTLVRKSLRQQLGLNDSTTLILFVARLTEQKQPAVLARSLHLLSEKYKDYKCIIIGDGPDEALIKNLLKKFKLTDNTVILGSQPNLEVIKYMDAADIFFLPSTYEGIALSIYEAMAMSLPIVAAEVGGQAELVKKDCGHLIKRSTPENEAINYSDSLEELCRDKGKAKLMGMAGRKRVEQYFGLQQAVSQIDVSIRNIIPTKIEFKDKLASSNIDLTLINYIRHLESRQEILQERLLYINKFKFITAIAKKAYSLLKRIKK